MANYRQLPTVEIIIVLHGFAIISANSNAPTVKLKYLCDDRGQWAATDARGGRGPFWTKGACRAGIFIQSNFRD